jgi:hypothetical protein
VQLRLLSFLLLVALFPLASSAGDKKSSPYRNVKIGDYVNYCVTSSVMGKEVSSDMKVIVTARDGDKVTVKMTAMHDGKELASETTKLDLNEPFDPAVTFALQEGVKAKYETKASGKERTKVGDKTYDCTWVSGKLVMEFDGKKEESAAKFWISDKIVPLGLIRAEMKSDLVGEVRILIVDHGNEM